MKLLLKRENVWILAISLIYILINAELIYLGFPWLNFLPVVLFVIVFAFFSLDTLMFILIFFVPLSISLSKQSGGLGVHIYLPTEPILIEIMFLFFIKVIYEGKFDKRILKHPVTLAIIFYLIWTFITCFTSEIPIVSFKSFTARTWFIVVFYLVASQLFRKFKNIRKYNWLYISSLIIVICYFIIRLNAHGLGNKNAANWVVSPFYNDHTAYAAAISMLLPFVTGMVFVRRKSSLMFKLFCIFLFVFFICALVLSYTRAAWLSLAVACIFLISMLLKIKLKFLFLALLILTGIFFAFRAEILISLERNKQDSSKYLSKHIASATNISSDASNRERINRWKCAIRMFKERPFFGFGPNTYQFMYAPYQKKEDETIISTNTGLLGNAHSEYLGPLSESGIIGALSFILIVIATTTTASRIFSRKAKESTINGAYFNYRIDYLLYSRAFKRFSRY